jgi:hypothetical protein
MKILSMTRRRLLAWTPALLLVACQDASRARQEASATLTLYTFGDSILDCGHYNAYGVHPGQLIVRNNDKLFPEFKGRDLQSRGPARLDHRQLTAPPWRVYALRRADSAPMRIRLRY